MNGNNGCIKMHMSYQQLVLIQSLQLLDGRLNLQLMFGMKLVLARINKPTL